MSKLTITGIQVLKDAMQKYIQGDIENAVQEQAKKIQAEAYASLAESIMVYNCHKPEHGIRLTHARK